MTTITVTEMEPDHFGVQAEERAVTTSHRVHVSPALLDDVGLSDAGHARVVHASIGFLLEREPATSILPTFALDDIARHHPECYDELKARLSA